MGPPSSIAVGNRLTCDNGKWLDDAGTELTEPLCGYDGSSASHPFHPDRFLTT